jgi:PKD repeat protein
VPTFNGNNASFAQVGTAASGVAGSPFPGNCSIGGFWYTGNLFPANYRNTYFHADYGAQWIKSFTIGFTDVVQKVEDFASGITAITCLTENPLDGTLVYVDIGTNTVKRVGFGGNQLPVAKATSDVTFGPSVLNVNFTGNTSFDPEGAAVTYLWNFGDATTSTVANPTHSFTSAGNVPKKFTVTLTVKDNMNATAVDSIIISVNNTPPVVHITSPVNNSLYRPTGTDTIYALTATVTDAEHVPGQLKYEWQKVLRHNNHEHQSPVDTTRSSTVSISRIGCNGEEYYWMLKLKVTDAAGLSTSDSSKIFPDCGAALVLKEFNVTQLDGENVVKWVTESEEPLKNYEVEVSSDGRNFFTINNQLSRDRKGLSEYRFNDNSFQQGINYYRLKMIDKAMTARYSAVVKIVSAQQGQGLLIYPNPVVGKFSIRYNAVNAGIVTVRISDINGRLISSSNRNVGKGQNILTMENMPGWKPGMFVVSVQEGNVMQQGKLLYQGNRPGSR